MPQSHIILGMSNKCLQQHLINEDPSLGQVPKRRMRGTIVRTIPIQRNTTCGPWNTVNPMLSMWIPRAHRQNLARERYKVQKLCQNRSLGTCTLRTKQTKKCDTQKRMSVRSKGKNRPMSLTPTARGLSVTTHNDRKVEEFWVTPVKIAGRLLRCRVDRGEKCFVITATTL